MLLEVAAGRAGDDDDLGAVGVSSATGESVILGPPNMSFNSNYRTRYPAVIKDVFSVPGP